jgi:HK97 family phage prohead protease
VPPKDRTIRQHRNMPTAFRAVNREGKKRIEGYFAVFDGIYTLWPGATESVDRHAFDDCLSDDVRALIDHETRLVLGRTKAGTLTLRVDDHGLWGDAEINENDTDAMNLYARVQRGDVDQCSFGFDILEENTDFREDGTVHWTLKKVKLYEVSCVTFPAYEDTSIEARRQDYDQLRRRELDAWKARQKGRFKHA